MNYKYYIYPLEKKTKTKTKTKNNNYKLIHNNCYKKNKKKKINL